MKSERLDLCNEIINTCIKMESSGINQGTSGNVSVRYKNGFLITPTSLPYNEMSPEDIVEMDWNGEYLGRRPSSEWRFHRDILKSRDDVNVVLHCHSINATAVACHKKNIPAFHYIVGLAGGKDIKCADYATFGTEELSNNVIKALENRSACLMSNHGQVAFGKNLDSAFELAQEIENICHQYTIALKLGKPKILSFEEMKKVLDKAKNYKKG